MSGPWFAAAYGAVAHPPRVYPRSDLNAQVGHGRLAMALASLGHLRVTAIVGHARWPFGILPSLALFIVTSCSVSSIFSSPLVSARRSARGSSRCFLPTPNEGAAERRKAHTGSSITLARRDAALTARGDPGATGIAPLGAPPWRFPAAGPRFNSGSVHRIHVATCPPARSQDLADWVPYLPCRGSLRRPRDATLPLRLSGSSPETPLMSENESGVA